MYSATGAPRSTCSNASGRDLPGFRLTTIGNDSVNEEFDTLVEETLLRGELFGVSLAFVVLLLVFGAAVAAGLPIVLAIVSIVVAVGATALVGELFELSTFVVNIITMIGLAVGIDYSLFIVQRYREERERGLDKLTAIERSGATANRAVFFSGLAVVIALSGMFIIPDTVFRSIAVGTILVVVASVAAALTLLPAVLSLLGDRVNRLTLPWVGRRRSPEIEGGAWSAIARAVTRRPALTAGAVAIALIAVASWYTTINLGSNGISSLPADSDGRHTFEVLNAEFRDSPNEAEIVIDAPRIDAPRRAGGRRRVGSATRRGRGLRCIQCGPSALPPNDVDLPASRGGWGLDPPPPRHDRTALIPGRNPGAAREHRLTTRTARFGAPAGVPPWRRSARWRRRPSGSTSGSAEA